MSDLVGNTPARAGGRRAPLLVGQIGDHTVERFLLRQEVGCDGGKIVHRSAFGSRGRPRTSSPMMLRWITNVPPPTVKAGEKRNP